MMHIFLSLLTATVVALLAYVILESLQEKRRDRNKPTPPPVIPPQPRAQVSSTLQPPIRADENRPAEKPIDENQDNERNDSEEEDTPLRYPPPPVEDKHKFTDVRDLSNGVPHESPSPQPIEPTEINPASDKVQGLRTELLRLLQGDTGACDRLLGRTRRLYPEASEEEVYRRVMDDLKRDRRLS